MKHQGTLALFHILSLAASGAATSVTLHSKRAAEASQSEITETETGTLSDGSFLDLSSSAAEERTALFDRLSKAEALTGTERQALRAQQQVLIALEQEQESLASKVSALEANDQAISSGEVVAEKGTIRNSAAQAQLSRRKVQAKHSSVHEVIRKERNKASARTMSRRPDNAFVLMMRESEKSFWEQNNKAFWERMTGVFCYIIQIFIVAILYIQFCKQKVTPKLPEAQVRTDEFQFGVFDASDFARDCQMCVCACCCPWIRWAETASKEHIRFLAFFPGLFITALLASSGSITFGASMLILVLIVVICRQRIREAYGLPSGSCGILLSDCVLWICCPCCAIVQEARQVEYVEVPMQEYGDPMGGP